MSESLKQENVILLQKENEKLKIQVENTQRDFFMMYEYSQNLLDKLMTGIIVLDDRFVVTRINKKTEEFFGTDMAILGREFKSVVRSPLGQENMFANKKIIDLDGEQFEFNLITPQGEIPVLCFCSCIQKVHDFELIMVINNISDQKEKEAENKKLQEQIIRNAFQEGVAETAVAVLHNIGNILTAMISKIQEAQESKDMEDLNTLLCKLSNYMDANKGACDGKVEKAIKVIKEELGKLHVATCQNNKFLIEKTRHIGDIITSQQKYANTKKSIRTKNNLAIIVADCFTLFEDSLRKRKINIEYADFDNSIIIYIDKIGFAQVLSNIIVNAMESIDEEIKIGNNLEKHKIEVRAKEEDGYVLLSFKDTGNGISPENLANLFSFGYSTKNRSSGFGLHNTANFMRASEGEIDIQSDGIGKGALVQLKIPIFKNK